MKEGRFATADKQATNGFFDEYPHDYSPLQKNIGIAKPCVRTTDPTRESAPVSRYLKQAFLFFPGTFLLFYISVGAVLAATDTFSREVFFSPIVFLTLCVGLLAAFMTWVGLGDIKNKKHFVIPASIIVSGASLGALVRAGDKIVWIAEKIIDDFGYAVWLFPFALIVPFLAKGWVDWVSNSGNRNSD